MEIKSILVIRLSSMGDIIRAVPALKSIKEKIQRVVFLTEDRFSETACLFPYYDRVILFPRKNLNLLALKNFFYELRSERFDLTLDLHGILKSAIIASLSKCEKKLGYPKNFSKEFSHLFYRDKIYCSNLTTISRFERYNFALKQIGITPLGQDKFYHPYLPEEAKSFADGFIKKNNLQKGNFAVLFIGTSKRQKFKRWPVFRFNKLAALLEKEMNLKCVFLYGPDEEELVEKFDSKFVISEPQGLMKTAALILSSALFVGADTGLMHLSAISGIKTVAVMGVTNPIVNRPYGRFAEVVFRENVIEECKGELCPHRNCMGTITECDVFEKVRILFEK